MDKNIKLIACVDCYYYLNYAKVALIVFENNSKEQVINTYSKIIPKNTYASYQSGQFYKRELPCILSLFKDVKEKIDLVIIDGYVYLNNNLKGLGAHLYKQLFYQIPIIGVAKTYYKDINNFNLLFRGTSKKPLYITSIGIDLNYSTNLIKDLKGKYRIPDLLKRVDSLTKIYSDRI